MVAWGSPRVPRISLGVDLELSGVQADAHAACWNGLAHRPENPLDDEPAVFGRAPVLMEVQAAEAERAAAVGPPPRPGDGLRLAVDHDLHHRLGARRLPQPIVELV